MDRSPRGNDDDVALDLEQVREADCAGDRQSSAMHGTRLDLSAPDGCLCESRFLFKGYEIDEFDPR